MQGFPQGRTRGGAEVAYGRRAQFTAWRQRWCARSQPPRPRRRCGL